MPRRPHPADPRDLRAGSPSRRDILRNGVLLGGGALATAAVSSAALGACGGGSATTEAGPAATPRNALLAAFPQSVPHVPVGVPTRLPYLISDPEGVPLTTIDGPVTFTVLRDGEQVGEPVEVAPRSEDVPRAYLPLTFTFPEPVIYDVVASYGGADLDSTLQVYDRARVGPPVVGEPLPPADTPTTTQPLDVDPMCSRPTACPFHATNLRDAVGAGRPMVVMVSTPAFCQTAVCGPVLDTLVELAADRPDLTVIHSEVYRNPKAVRELTEANPAPLPEAYRLAFEPTMFVTNAAGVIVARADVVVDRSEMQELLALAR